MKIINIAVVDDEASVGFLYKVNFKKEIKNREITLHFFQEGQKLLDFMARENSVIEILILVSDINMPGMDGVTLASLVKKAYPSVDIYLSSGYDQSTSEDYIKSSVIKGYFSKPVNFDIVREIIKKKYNLYNT